MLSRKIHFTLCVNRIVIKMKEIILVNQLLRECVSADFEKNTHMLKSCSISAYRGLGTCCWCPATEQSGFCELYPGLAEHLIPFAVDYSGCRTSTKPSIYSVPDASRTGGRTRLQWDPPYREPEQTCRVR